MKVLITGGNGFVAKNLIATLAEREDIEVLAFTRQDEVSALPALVRQADFIFHLAGVNRPENPEEFKAGNIDLTRALCEAIASTGRQLPIVYTSSTQAEQANPYGESKRGAEEVLIQFSKSQKSVVFIFRLPNVFGKWARANYNSAVATFCHNIARNLPIQVNDPLAVVRLVYIDDVIARFIAVMDGDVSESPFVAVEPEYSISLGDLTDQLHAFRNSRNTLITDKVGSGLTRALYSTYVSYLPPECFSYDVPKYGDERGVFVEMLKTRDSGQFSFFTAHPGVTRGGHYHHSKTEKFLVIKGKACFRFRHIGTDEYYELRTSGEKPEIVETVPGWTHDITNTGDVELVVMLWANEIFDRARPDTYTCPV